MSRGHKVRLPFVCDLCLCLLMFICVNEKFYKHRFWTPMDGSLASYWVSARKIVCHYCRLNRNLAPSFMSPLTWPGLTWPTEVMAQRLGVDSIIYSQTSPVLPLQWLTLAQVVIGDVGYRLLHEGRELILWQIPEASSASPSWHTQMRTLCNLHLSKTKFSTHFSNVQV